MIHSESIVALFEEVLNEKKCYELARLHKFIERKSSKLKGHEFIKALIVPSEGLSTDSLQGLVVRIREFNSDADISAQALCERINHESSNALMRGVYAEILSYKNASPIKELGDLKELKNFNCVYIEDSTVMMLNEKLQECFHGTNRGGTGAKSQVKIDLIYELMQDTIINTELFHGKEPDQGLASRIIQFIKPGDLVLRDQGYFVLNVFQKISELSAFFISRLLPHVKIYLNREDLKPIDLGRYLEKHYFTQKIIDIPSVFVGDEKVPMRLILYRLPTHIVEGKLREANKRAKATGREMSRGKRLLLQFAAFVTNVSEELISAEVIGTIYRLRWEIELIFKRWKSQLRIDYLKGINNKRIECLIWSRLCSLLIIEMVTGYIKTIARKMTSSNVEVSHNKAISYILRNSEFCKGVTQYRLEEFLKRLAKDIPRMLLKDKRARKTMRERADAQDTYYDTQPSVNQWVA